MKNFVDEIYLNDDLTKKTKIRLLSVLFVDGMEDKNSTYKNLVYYIKELIENLKERK